jgi:putative endonuclease
MKEHNYYVYILASKRNGTFYTGVTNDLLRRVYEHKEKLAEGFTKKHGVHMLVYYEHTSDINAALHREKLIKKWRRSIKMEAIERMNPDWRDLYYDLTGESYSDNHATMPGWAPSYDGVTSSIEMEK